MGVSNSAPVSVNWSSASNLHGDSAGEDINNLMVEVGSTSSSTSLDAKKITQNVTELELNFLQAHANKNKSGKTDISDSQYSRLESGLHQVIDAANTALSSQSDGKASGSSLSTYVQAINSLINDMQGEFLKTSGSSYSSFSGGTNGYISDGAINMAALYTPPSQSALSAASTASAEPQGLSGASSWETPSSFSLYPGGSPKLTDINQGGIINDCFFDTVLAGMVSTSSGASAIQQSISALPDTTPSAFSVTMYAPDGSPVHIAVDDTVPKGTNGQQTSASTAVTLGANNTADWATIMEKAFAKYADMYPESVLTSEDDVGQTHGYDMLNRGSNPIGAMMALTGVSTAVQPISPSSDSSSQAAAMDQIEKQLQAGGIITAITPASTSGESSGSTTVKDTSGKDVPLHYAHAYTITKTADGNFSLHNPWGGDNADITLSQKTFFEHFIEYEYNMPGQSLSRASTPSSSSQSASPTDAT